MYKNYFFDLYGTLVDIRTDEQKPSLWQGAAEFYSLCGAPYTAAEIHARYLALCAEETEILAEACPALGTQSVEIELRNVFRRLFQEKGITVSATRVEDTAVLFRLLSFDREPCLMKGVKETLEELRFFLNTKIDSESPLALILVGQTELRTEKLQLQRYAAIRQRIDMNCILPHLDRAETEKYIGTHLTYAGGSREIFTSRALDEIYRNSTGIPRVINRICEKSLLYAFQQQKRLIDDHMVLYVVEDEMLGERRVK